MLVLRVWLALLFVVALIFLGCWFVLILERTFPGKGFDERQRQARSNAYRYGFWLGILYYALAAAVICVAKPDVEEIVALICFGILIQMTAACAYMLLTDAVLPFSEKPKLIFLFEFLMAGWQLTKAFQSARATQQVFGTAEIPWVNLILSVSWLLLGVMYLVSWLKERRHGE